MFIRGGSCGGFVLFGKEEEVRPLGKTDRRSALAELRRELQQVG